MRRDQRPSFAATVAELDGELACPFKGIERLRDRWAVVQSHDVVGTSEPQESLHLLGGGVLLRRLAHRDLQIGSGLAAAEQSQQQFATRAQRGPPSGTRVSEFGRLGEKSQCLRRREAGGCRGTSLMQVLCRPFPSPRLHQVVGKITRILIEVPGIDPLKCVGDTAMQALPPHERQPAEKRLADLLMGEDEARPPALLGHQQPGALGSSRASSRSVLGFVSESRQELKREGPPDACRGRQDALRSIADAVDAASEYEPDRFRHLDLADLDLGKPFAPASVSRCSSARWR